MAHLGCDGGQAPECAFLVDQSVAVSKRHLLTILEDIVVFLIVMNRSDQTVRVLGKISPEYLLEKRMDGSEMVVHLVH